MDTAHVGDTSLTPRAGKREWLALAVLTLTVTLLAVDGTVLALAVPALTEALNPTSTQLLWIGDIYSFAIAGLLITMGNVADRVGRKKLLLIGATGFGIASVLAAFAPTAEMLIAARVLLGISGATLMPSTLSLIRGMFHDPAQRTRAVAVWSAGAAGGAAMGPLVGGALLENFWWGSVFLINIPVMLVVLVAGSFLLMESRSEHRAPIDLTSAVLSLVTIVPVVYAVKTFAKSGLSALVVVALVVGVAAGLAFVRRQQRLPHPLIDVSLFKVPAFSGSVISIAIAIFAMSGLLFFFSQYLQFVRGFRPLHAGLAELPMTLAMLATVVIVGRLVVKLGRGRSVALGLFVTAAGLAGLAVAEGLSNFIWLLLAMAVIGAGIAVANTVGTDTVVSVVPRDRAGAASAISETAYELGIALGIAVLGSVQAAFYTRNLQIPDELPADLRQPVADSLASATSVLGSEYGAVLEAAKHAFTSSMQLTAVIAAVLAAVAGLIAVKVLPSTKESLSHDSH